MAFAYVVSTTERSIIDVNAPSADLITRTLQSVVINGGAWVGPGPRVTREFQWGLSSNLTHVAWVFSLDAPLTQSGADALAQQIGMQVQDALAGISSDWDPVTVTPFSPAVNGPLTWWQNGDDMASPTRDSFPQLGGRLAPNENPVGPDNPQTTLPTVGQGVGQQVGQATQPFTGGGAGGQSAIQQTTALIATVGIVAAVGIGVWLLWPVLTGARKGEQAVVAHLPEPEHTRAHPNPSGGRRSLPRPRRRRRIR